MSELWRCDGERELFVSASVMPPRCAVSYCCKCAELCKSIGLVLESIFMPRCSNNVAKKKTKKPHKNTRSKEGNEKVPGFITVERGPPVRSTGWMLGVCRFPALLAVSLLYVRPAY